MSAPSAQRKSPFANIVDVQLLLAILATLGFYWIVNQESMKDGLLYRYTTEHAVEYVIVAFFMWGICDVIVRALGFPRESLALRQDLLPPRRARLPVSQAAVLQKQLQSQPKWVQTSRLGMRYSQALAFLQEKGSAAEFSDYLRYLAEQDDEKTYTNFGLVRFICWVTPVLGFLGTVLHFGTALGGLSVDEIGDKLAAVVAEMGSAFNTTTVALTAATTMMFALFLCERTERAMIHQVDRRADRDLMNRFDVADANMTPFLGALDSANQSTIRTIETTVERQVELWSGALTALQQQAEGQQQIQAQQWQTAMQKLEQRFEANDVEREKRLLRALESMETARQEHRQQLQESADRVASLQAELAELVAPLAGISHSKGQLIELESALAENLRLLRETAQIDQALHGLTAAIHLLTARAQPSAFKAERAA